MNGCGMSGINVWVPRQLPDQHLSGSAQLSLRVINPSKRERLHSLPHVRRIPPRRCLLNFHDHHFFVYLTTLMYGVFFGTGYNIVTLSDFLLAYPRIPCLLPPGASDILGLFGCFTSSLLFIVVDTSKTTAWCLAWL